MDVDSVILGIIPGDMAKFPVSAASVVHLCHTTHTYKTVDQLILDGWYWVIFHNSRKRLFVSISLTMGHLCYHQRIKGYLFRRGSMITFAQALEAANVEKIYVLGYTIISNRR